LVNAAPNFLKNSPADFYQAFVAIEKFRFHFKQIQSDEHILWLQDDPGETREAKGQQEAGRERLLRAGYALRQHASPLRA
jgi:ribosomal protein L15E